MIRYMVSYATISHSLWMPRGSIGRSEIGEGGAILRSGKALLALDRLFGPKDFRIFLPRKGSYYVYNRGTEAATECLS